MISKPKTTKTVRYQQILELINRQSSVEVNTLSQILGVSTVTTRADLRHLESIGKLKRTHGGAIALTPQLSPTKQDKRIPINLEAKQEIAYTALQYVEDSSTVFLDSGTTTLELVKLLNARDNLTIVTADISIADMIDRMPGNHSVIMLGGHLKKGHRYTTGPIVLSCLSSLFVDVAFICPFACLPSQGFFSNQTEMGAIKTQAIQQSNQTIVLMDSSKINKHTLSRFATFNDIDILITNEYNNEVAHECATSTCTFIVTQNQSVKFGSGISLL